MIKITNFMWHFLYCSHCAIHLTWITSFNVFNNAMRKLTLIKSVIEKKTRRS